MEQTDKTTTKNPLLKSTRAQLIEMLEAQKTEYNKLKSKAEIIIEHNKELKLKLEDYKTNAMQDGDLIEKYYTSCNLWKFLASISCLATILMLLYCITR